VQLKKTYKLTKATRNASGFGWDATACQVTASLSVWEDYLKVCLIQTLTNHMLTFSLTGAPQGQVLLHKGVFGL
jgi:hypothetical protein